MYLIVGSFTKPRTCTLVNFTGETKKLSYLFAFCYILVRFRLKAYFKFIKRVQVIHWQSFMFLAYCETFKKNM